ncbi:hypothetical protein LOTGIDRAFT_170851 [Lottia gigantea]|uniref:poly(ADP-ribose) glycohydrolase n=1 Tax=Lottia gigantea TaxID=225164 RepID=V4CPM2_LOTGI|nr:hypothetical protein LOTGIDRAFT_170851 [Lottia gigantea]ESP04350.1 hypothetical protein LOTGIDRAFT_170851 [Lottia gigantea]
MNSDLVQLPIHLPSWCLVKKALLSLQDVCVKETCTTDQVLTALNKLSEKSGASELSSWSKRHSKPRSKEGNTSIWFGFGNFLKQTDESERLRIIHELLPAISQLAIDLETFPSTDIQFSKQQTESTTTLSRSLIASLLACGFFSLYSTRERHQSGKLNEVNFISLLKNLPLPAQIGKLQCILNYFHKVTTSERDRIGTVTYTRKCLKEPRIPVMEDYLTSDQELCPIIVHNEGRDEICRMPRVNSILYIVGRDEICRMPRVNSILYIVGRDEICRMPRVNSILYIVGRDEICRMPRVNSILYIVGRDQIYRMSRVNSILYIVGRDQIYRMSRVNSILYIVGRDEICRMPRVNSILYIVGRDEICRMPRVNSILYIVGRDEICRMPRVNSILYIVGRDQIYRMSRVNSILYIVGRDQIYRMSRVNSILYIVGRDEIYGMSRVNNILYIVGRDQIYRISRVNSILHIVGRDEICRMSRVNCILYIVGRDQIYRMPRVNCILYIVGRDQICRMSRVNCILYIVGRDEICRMSSVNCILYIEEIRFIECPELIVSQLFMECMEDNEAIVISGYKQYSKHSGYSSTFTFEGDFEPQEEGDNLICCIDATTFRNKVKKLQYTEKFILREVNKALIGFTGQSLFSCHGDDIEKLNGSSSDDDFHTALESSDDDQSPRIISEYASQMLQGLLSQATREVVEKNKSHKKAKRVSNNELMAAAGNMVIKTQIMEPPKEVLSDGQIIVGSTEQLNNQNHLLSANIFDGIDTECGDWLHNIRRRSSNLSDVNSRRSSSSTKHSSDVSSDLDELYESYIKSEKSKHGTIHEESYENINDFAAKLISCLMQEGTSKAASMMPGVQDFDICPPSSAIKPKALREQNDKDAKEIPIAEAVAEKLFKSVFTHAVLEAVSILGAKNNLDSSSTNEHSLSMDKAKIPDESYIWFADRIVQDAFLQASAEVSQQPEINVENANSLDSNITSQPNTRWDPNLSRDSLSSGDSNPPRLSISSVADETNHNSSLLSGYDSSGSSLCSDNRPFSDQKPNYRTDRIRNSSMNSDHSDDLVSPSDIYLSGGQPATAKAHQQVSVTFNLDEAAANIVKKVIKSIPSRLDEEDFNASNVAQMSDDHCIKSEESASLSEKNKTKDHSHSVTFAQDKSSPLPWSNFSKREDRGKRNDSTNLGILTKKLSRETVTNAYLKVENKRHTKSYERRSSEPCHISVERSLQALDNEKAACDMDKRNRKISKTDEDFDRCKADSKRRGSWDVPSGRRRSSCGFIDPVLSHFAEELMKADTSIPPLNISQKPPSSSTTGSRRSSISAFKDQVLASFDMELLGSSFDSKNEPPSSPRQNSFRRRSRDSRLVRSDSSDTEYMWFPPPRRVGVEFQEDYQRLQNYHSVDEIVDFADMIAQNVLEEAVIILNREQEANLEEDSIRDIEQYASEISVHVIDSAFSILKNHAKDLMSLSNYRSDFSLSDLQNDSCDDYHDALDINIHVVEKFAEQMAAKLMKNVMTRLYRPKHKLDEFISNGRLISTGNWGCGAFRGDPHLKSLLQWMAASIVHTPTLHYFIFGDPRLVKFEEVIEFIKNKNWSVGDVMKVILQYCTIISDDADYFDDGFMLPLTLFDYLLTF